LKKGDESLMPAIGRFVSTNELPSSDPPNPGSLGSCDLHQWLGRFSRFVPAFLGLPLSVRTTAGVRGGPGG
jgi:hypothetical protein